MVFRITLEQDLAIFPKFEEETETVHCPDDCHHRLGVNTNAVYFRFLVIDDL